jgi:hypothetical protein
LPVQTPTKYELANWSSAVSRSRCLLISGAAFHVRSGSGRSAEYRC